MPRRRSDTGSRLIAAILILAAAGFTTEARAQSSDDTAAVVFDGLSRPATSISATTPIIVPAVGTSGIAGPYPASLVVSGISWTIGRIAVRLNDVSHTNPGNLDVLLVAPDGQKILLMSDAGGSNDLEHTSLTFQLGAPALPGAAQIFSGTYSPTDLEPGESLPAPAPAAPYSSSLILEGMNPNGTWKLFVADDTDGDVGSIGGFTLIITPKFDNTSPVPVPPTGTVGTTESTLVVAGVTAPITNVRVSLSITHTFDSDLAVSLIGPDGTVVPLITNRGGSGDNIGSSCALGGRAYFDDSGLIAVAAATPPFAPTNRPESPLSAFNGKSGTAANGTWRLRVVDGSTLDSGTLNCWSVYISQDENTIVQPPTSLTATSVSGNQVTLRWVPPGAGPAPTSYLIEGGVNPGETLATIPTGSANPILTFAAPSGAFRVRVRSQTAAGSSEVSNEIPLFVNVPAPPSPPSQLLAVRNGSSVGLSWRNTFFGGAPAALILDVIGAAVASIPLPLAETITFSGVPPGTYTLQLRAANAAGVGTASNLVTLSLPSGCASVPEKPFNFLAYKIGATVFAVWEPNASGDATTAFIVDVTGDFTGRLPVAGRSLSGTVGPGVYRLSVAATNSCGTSAFTPVQVVTIP